MAKKQEPEPENWAAFVEGMARLSAIPAFGYVFGTDDKRNRETMDVYWMFLRAYSAKEIQTAFIRAIDQATTTCPTPAQIKGHARAIHIEATAPARPVAEYSEQEKEELRSMLEDLKRKCRSVKQEN